MKLYFIYQTKAITLLFKLVNFTLMSDTEEIPKKPRKKGSGGARPNSGPKNPVLDKKKTVAIYPRASWLEKLGGDIAVRAIATKAVEQAALQAESSTPKTN